jgi:hypothetical protein
MHEVCAQARPMRYLGRHVRTPYYLDGSLRVLLRSLQKLCGAEQLRSPLNNFFPFSDSKKRSYTLNDLSRRTHLLAFCRLYGYKEDDLGET